MSLGVHGHLSIANDKNLPRDQWLDLKNGVFAVEANIHAAQQFLNSQAYGGQYSLCLQYMRPYFIFLLLSFPF